MDKKSERAKKRGSGESAMATCKLTDAEGNEAFVGRWVKPKQSQQTPKPESDKGKQKP
jgi:hypothetical protein